jgi:hypothetical protein
MKIVSFYETKDLYTHYYDQESVMTKDFKLQETEQEGESQTCAACQGAPQPRYKVLLCQGCRTKLSRKPIPVLIKGAGLLVAVALTVALTRIPGSMLGAIAFERGHKYEMQSNYKEASAEYQKAVDAFPNSSLCVARLGIVEYRLGDFFRAVETLRKLA